MPIDRPLEPLFGIDDLDMGADGLTVVEDQEIPEDSMLTEMDDGSMVVVLIPWGLKENL